MNNNYESPRVVFDGDESRNFTEYSEKKTKMAQLVISNSGGLVKNETQANYVLVALVGVIIVISVMLMSGGEDPSKIKPPNMERMKNLQNPPRL